MTQPIISLRNVVRTYADRHRTGWRTTYFNAADGVDLDVQEGEILAIVGESGSGKSTLAKMMLQLEKPTSGQVLYCGQDLAQASRSRIHDYRCDVQAVFQDPSSSLNPRMRVRQSLSYVARRHKLEPPEGLDAFLIGQLESVGLHPAPEILLRYPHQLSGGQQQRVAIARAMMLSPSLIVADEPLSALDVSIQAQILDLMRDLSRSRNVGFVLISHDLNAVQSIADRIAVMYRGSIVEIGRDILTAPAHPYTHLLLEARLSFDPRQRRAIPEKVPPVDSPTPLSPQGCQFRDRCPLAIETCAEVKPRLEPTGHGDALAACHMSPSPGETPDGEAPPEINEKKQQLPDPA